MFYVYRIACRPTGEYYYGSRYRHARNNIHPKDDLWIRYFTSSTNVKKLIDLYGKDQFDFEFILISEDKNQCFALEQELIKQHIHEDKCLNLQYRSVGGSAVFNVYGQTLSTKGISKSEITKSRMRKPKSLEHRLKISKVQLDKGGNGPKTIVKKQKLK